MSTFTPVHQVIEGPGSLINLDCLARCPVLSTLTAENTDVSTHPSLPTGWSALLPPTPSQADTLLSDLASRQQPDDNNPKFWGHLNFAVKLNTSIGETKAFSCISSSPSSPSSSPALAGSASVSTIVRTLHSRASRSPPLIPFHSQSYPGFTVQKERRDGGGTPATSFLPTFTPVRCFAHCGMRSIFAFP